MSRSKAKRTSRVPLSSIFVDYKKLGRSKSGPREEAGPDKSPPSAPGHLPTPDMTRSEVSPGTHTFWYCQLPEGAQVWSMCWQL